MTNKTQRRTILGFTIPEVLLICALITSVAGGVQFIRAEANDVMINHDQSQPAHFGIASRVQTLESDMAIVRAYIQADSIWKYRDHPKEVNRAIETITKNMLEIVQGVYKP